MDDKRVILHIEDEEEIFELVVEILSHPQVEIVSAQDGPAGLKMASELHPDLILLDIMLPEMDGFQVYEHLQESPETAKIPVVMLTAKSRPHERIRARTIQGLEGYVGKPFGVMDLRRHVEKNLGVSYKDIAK